MLQYILCESGTVQDPTKLLITVRSSYMKDDLIDRIKDAVKEFVETPSKERDTALSATGGNFNWGDLALWLPEKIAMGHGFEIMDAVAPDILRDHDESLLPEGFEYE